MRWNRMIFIALGSMLFSGVVSAQSGIKEASTDPYARQFAVEFSQGTIVVADDSTQTVYISLSDGQEYDVPFSQAITSAEADPYKRQQMLTDFRASLGDVQHVVSVRAPRVATDTNYWPKMCGEFACIDPDGLSAAKQERGSVHASTHQGCDFKCSPFPCDLGPCSPNTWVNGQFFYSGKGAGWDPGEGGGTVTQQDLVAYDKQRWENERKQACTDKNINAAETSAIGGATGATCLTFETGVGAVGCAAGVIAYGIGLYKTDKAADRCQAGYPGIGNW